MCVCVRERARASELTTSLGNSSRRSHRSHHADFTLFAHPSSSDVRRLERPDDVTETRVWLSERGRETILMRVRTTVDEPHTSPFFKFFFYEYGRLFRDSTRRLHALSDEGGTRTVRLPVNGETCVSVCGLYGSPRVDWNLWFIFQFLGLTWLTTLWELVRGNKEED